jgi:SAM-dependent methyltransferase
MSDITDDKSYYSTYYDRMGANSYLGEGAKHSSRMLVFCEWLRAELKPGAKVLDVGCGDAVFAELMPEFEWYGVDINTERAEKRISRVDRAVGYCNDEIVTESGRLATQDLMKPPYPWPDKYFDAIISSECTEHLWDLRIVHKEAKRLLKREGPYIISTPNFQWLTNHLEHFQRIRSQFDQHWTIEHIRHYDFDLHKRYLNEVGFVVEKHQGADEMYCPIMANVANFIQAGLRERGHEISTPELGVMMGKAIPHYMHTTVIMGKKA